MIIYFADKTLTKVLGRASTNLNSNFIIKSDTKSEDVDAGVSTFDAVISFEDETRLELRSMLQAGNYILIGQDKEGDATAKYNISGASSIIFKIITDEESAKNKEIRVYAEDGSMGLLNALTEDSYDGYDMKMSDYISHFLTNTGYEYVEYDDLSGKQLDLSWSSPSTVLSRLQEIAIAFDYEIRFEFDISGFKLRSKKVVGYKTIGKERSTILYLNKHIDDLTVQRSIENLATGLKATANNGEVTLYGYSPTSEQTEDGDFATVGYNLVSQKAYETWGGSALTGSHLIREWNCEVELTGTALQSQLFDKAKEQLKKQRDAEVNYNVSIVDFPDDVNLGDRISIVDDAGEIYISGRVLKLETSGVTNERKATLGEFLIKTSGISQKVIDLADKVSKLKNGLDGQDAISLTVASSNGLIFKNAVSSVLTATVFKGLTKITTQAELEEVFGSSVYIQWYKDGEAITGANLFTYQTIEKGNYTCKLEKEENDE